MNCNDIQAQIDTKTAELIPLQANLITCQAEKLISQANVMLAMTEDGTAASNLADAESAVATKLAELQTWQMIKTTSGC